MEEENRLFKLHDKYIRGTEIKAPVILRRILVARLSTVVVEEVRKTRSNFNIDKVYISTKAMKHIYDSRMAQEYEFILSNLPALINQPDELYKNKSEKRGDLLVVKSFESVTYDGEKIKTAIICSLDILSQRLCVTTAFKQSEERKKENYLKKYRPMWSWGGD